MKKSVARRKTRSYSSYLETKAFLKRQAFMHKFNHNVCYYGAYAVPSTNPIEGSLVSYMSDQIKRRWLIKARLRINPQNTYAKYI